jgi:hypothetical protein
MLCVSMCAHHAAPSPHIMHNCLLMLCLADHVSAVMALSQPHSADPAQSPCTCLPSSSLVSDLLSDPGLYLLALSQTCTPCLVCPNLSPWSTLQPSLLCAHCASPTSLQILLCGVHHIGLPCVPSHSLLWTLTFPIFHVDCYLIHSAYLSDLGYQQE